MPLRCIDPSVGVSIQAFDLSDDAWSELRSLNKRDLHLRMDCCDAPVVLKRSKLGTKFFAHKHEACGSAGETEEHRQLKTLVVEVARDMAWKAETEVVGDGWRADVFATNGVESIAIEVQLAALSEGETLSRHTRFAASGIRSLWLFRQKGVPSHRGVPSVRVLRLVSGGFAVKVPQGLQMLTLTLQRFLQLVFSGRIKYIRGDGRVAEAKLTWISAPCWQCRHPLSQISQLNFRIGDFRKDCDPSFIAKSPEVFSSISNRLGVDFMLGTNCTHCGSHVGRFSDIQHPSALTGSDSFRFLMEGSWLDIFRDHNNELSHWEVQGSVLVESDFFDGASIGRTTA